MVRQQVPVCGSPVILSIAEVGSDDSEDDDEVLNKFREQVQQRVWKLSTECPNMNDQVIDKPIMGQY